MADVRGDGEPHMANSPPTRSGEFNQEATKTIMDLPCELHERIPEQLAGLDYYYLYDLKETSKYFENLCQNFIKRNPERNYSAIFDKHDKLVCEAYCGRLDRVKFYIEEEKIDVDSVGIDFTALHNASRSRHIEVVNYLISKGANVNATGSRRCEPEHRYRTPLVHAVECGHVEVAKILIQNGAKTDIAGRNLLYLAVASNNIERISLVMSLGFDVQRHDDLDMTLLATAMDYFADQSVGFLLENGADYKKTSTSERFLPARYGISDENEWGTYHRESVRCLELLLDHIEQKEGRKGVVDYINSNDNSKGYTLLHDACRVNNDEVVGLLYCRGADLNIRDKKGRKPYDLLPIQAHWPIVERLFESDKQHQDCTPESRCCNWIFCRQNRKRRQYVNSPSVTFNSQQGERKE